MKHWLGKFVMVIAAMLVVAGCEREETQPAPAEPGATAATTHVHEDGSMHADHADAEGEHAEDDHAHDEVPLGTVMIGDMEVELAQGHGKLEPGKELHLVVKLPYDDQGETVVRAWIGTEDRLRSVVGKGEYAAGHDDYDIHATAPSPLPENAMWWIEIEKPDGTKVVGSAKPLMD